MARRPCECFCVPWPISSDINPSRQAGSHSCRSHRPWLHWGPPIIPSSLWLLGGCREEAVPSGGLFSRGRTRLALGSVAKELGKARWNSRPRSWGQAKCRACLGAACGFGTMRALSQLSLPLPCLATPCLLLLSSLFLPLWPGGWEWDSVCTWMEPTVSREARASHSSRTEVEVAFSRPRRALAGRGPSWEGRSHPGPEGPCSAASAWGLSCLSSSLPCRPQTGGRLPWCLSPCLLPGLGPTGLSPGGHWLPLGMEGGKESLSCGEWGSQSLITSTPE